LTPRLIHYEYNRPGKSVAVYDHWLIHDERDLQVLFMPRYDGAPIRFGDQLAIDRGGAMIWYLFPGKWYDIGSFYLPDGSHAGWYTNFCTPARVEGDNWFSTDLFLDHWTSVDDTRLWLDEDEYADAIRDNLITPEQNREVETGRVEILEKLERTWPPDAVNRFDLETALARLS
jgi:predicted RNA-binding protein associated with RNAse of E/G family